MKHHKRHSKQFKKRHNGNNLFVLKPLIQAVQDAVDNPAPVIVAPEVVPAVQPVKDEPVIMNPSSHKRHKLVPKELKAVFHRLFELTEAAGITPPYNKRGIGLEALFFKAVEVLPAELRPTSFSSYRERAYKALATKYRNRNWRTWAANQPKTPVAPAVTPAKAAVHQKVNLAVVSEQERTSLFTYDIPGLGTIGADSPEALEKAINHFSQRTKVGEQAKVPVKTKTVTRPTTPLSALVQAELKRRGILTKRQVANAIRDHNMSHKPLAAAHATLMALVRHGIVTQYDDERYALTA